MKAFVFGDTHGITDFSYVLDVLDEPVDVVIHVGDWTNFNEGFDEALEGLEDLQADLGVPVILTHGNHEFGSVRSRMKQYPNLTYIDQSVFIHGDVAFFGFGGGGFAEFEPKFERFIKQAHKDHANKASTHVWVLHGPPFDLQVDTRFDWGPTGSVSRREMIELLSPHVVCCGHIHEAWGVVHQHHDTLLINPGPDGMLLDLTQK